jgi:hypothetical protein
MPSRAGWPVGERGVSQLKTKGREPVLVAASFRAINSLRRYDQEAVELDGQQAAYQPSGNGTSGQGARLSLAACGGTWRGRVWAKKSSSGMGAMAVFTASSNRSNSTSFIVLSGVPELTISKLFCFQIERIAQILTIRHSRQT